LVLTAFAVAPDRQPAGNVLDDNATLGLVSRLSTRTRTSGRSEDEMTLLDFELLLGRLWHHGHGDGAGMDPIMTLSWWYSLPPVTAGLSAKILLRCLAGSSKRCKTRACFS